MELFGLLAAPVALAAFATAALSMDRHHRALCGAPCPPDRRRRLRAAAWGGFLLAVLIALAGGPVGLVAGVLASGLVAGLIVLGLTIRG